MNSKNRSTKKKRVDKNVYFSLEELQLVKSLALRTSLTNKPKPLSQVIRNCVLAVAKNPDLDLLIFAPSTKNQLSMDELLIRQKLLENIEDNLWILVRHGMDITTFLNNYPKVEKSDEKE